VVESSPFLLPIERCKTRPPSPNEPCLPWSACARRRALRFRTLLPDLQKPQLHQAPRFPVAVMKQARQFRYDYLRAGPGCPMKATNHPSG